MKRLEDVIKPKGLIDRKETLDALQEALKEFDEITAKEEFTTDQYLTVKDAIFWTRYRLFELCEKAILSLPPAESESPAWIPISESLPDEETEVLVTRKFLGTKDVPKSVYVETAERIGEDWCAISDEFKVAPSRHTKPIAWMPMPEPYDVTKEVR